MTECFLNLGILLSGILSFVSLLELPFETDKAKIRKYTILGLLFLSTMLFLYTLK